VPHRLSRRGRHRRAWLPEHACVIVVNGRAKRSGILDDSQRLALDEVDDFGYDGCGSLIFCRRALPSSRRAFSPVSRSCSSSTSSKMSAQIPLDANALTSTFVSRKTFTTGLGRRPRRQQALASANGRVFLRSHESAPRRPGGEALLGDFTLRTTGALGDPSSAFSSFASRRMVNVVICAPTETCTTLSHRLTAGSQPLRLAHAC